MSSLERHYLRKRTVWAHVAALAESQHGIVTSGELQALGVTRSVISSWTKNGYLHRVQPKVYSVGHARISIRGQWLAAVKSFACPAHLSDSSAAQLWGLTSPRLPIHITVPRRTRVSRQLRCRQRSDLEPSEQTVIDGIAVTTVPRTLFDLAATSLADRSRRSLDEVERIAATAWRKRVLDLEDLHLTLERSSRRRGVAAFRALVERLDPRTLASRSGGESLLIRLLEHAGLDGFEVNAKLGPYEVDVLWPAERLALEFDGAAYHSDSSAFETDHRRDAYLKARGYEVLRLTYRMVTESPAETVSTVKRLLARRTP